MILYILIGLFVLTTLYFAWKAQTSVTKILRLESQVLVAQSAHVSIEKDNVRLTEQIRFMTQAEEQMKDSFKSLAASTLESSTRHFLELAQTTLKSQTEQSRSDMDQKHRAFDDLIKPVSQSLEKYREQVSMLEKDRQRAFQSIDTELKRVVEMSGVLSRETANLKDALKRPNVRGRWGEVQLRNCIELAGMSEYADVEFQHVQVDEEGTHIPDMIVRMPGGRKVIVDSKTPIDAFLASLEAPTDETRAVEMARHGKHVKDHVRKLSSRSYNEILKDSADFTVLFLPNESFLYAALEQEPDLVEYALQRKILIATPPTLIGLLKVIRFGWNEERLAENAELISTHGKELHKRICDFVDGFEKIGKAIDKAKSEYDRGRARLQSRLIVQAQRFENLGVRSSKTLKTSEEESPSPEIVPLALAAPEANEADS